MLLSNLPAAYFESDTTNQPQIVSFENHRIELVHVIELFQKGMSQEQIMRHFPELEQNAIESAIDYYTQNKALVEQYIAETNAVAEKRRKSAPIHPAQARLERLLSRNRSA